jgi:hypothetical protein
MILFLPEHVKIVVSDGKNTFLDECGRPDKNNYSDHLPILFTLFTS